MKNNIKRIISFMLALVMMSGCISAFAADETIEWCFNPGDDNEITETLPYLGELTAGENRVGTDQDEDNFDDEGERVCYSFTAEADGYYLFTLGELTYRFNNYLYFSEEYVNGKAYGLIYDEYYQGVDGGLELIYYLTAGETAVIVQNIEELTLSYEFLGEEVTDVVYDENSLEGFLGEDYYTDKNSAYGNVGGGEVLFSSGKTFGFISNWFSVDKKLVKGENTIELEILGFKKEVTVKVLEAKDVIAKLEPKNLDDDLYATEYYNGYISSDDIGEAELDITYADGRTETVNFDGGAAQITLPNGRKYWAYVQYEQATLTAKLIFAGEVYETYELKVVPADFDENLAILNMNNSEWLDQANCDLQWRIDHLETADTLAEKVSLVFWIPGIYTNAFYQIFCNIVEFIEFYV